ncbi:MAG: cytochrome c3 family protein [Bryobacteraceae bacterium]
MAVIFPKSSDIILKVLGAVIGLGAVATVAAYTYYTWPTVIDTGYQPVQPIPYSHKLHAGEMGIDCYYCHTTVYKANFAAVPSQAACMKCHEQVKKDSPRLEPLRAAAYSGSPIPWVQVHRLPDYVYFSHQAHLSAGVSCVSCHGRVDQMIEVRQEKPLNMAWCLECHRNPAPNLRPAEFVTKLDWTPDRDPVEIGKEIIAQKHIEPPTNCSGCHR